MLVNLSGLTDLPASGENDPSRISAKPHLSCDGRSKSFNDSDETTQLPPRTHSVTAPTHLSQPPDHLLPNASTVGEPKEGNAIGSFLTARFEHAQTADGFIILTGRQGQITKCEDEPIRVPGAIQAFGVLVAVILHGESETSIRSHRSHHRPDDSSITPSEHDRRSHFPEYEDDTSTFTMHISRVEVVQVSENSGHILGLAPECLLNLHSFTDILSDDEAQVLFDNLEVTLEDGQTGASPHTFRLSGQGGPGSGLEGRGSRSAWTCWCAAHRPDPIRRPRLIIIEFELEADTLNPPSVISNEPLRYEERGGLAGEPYQPTEEDLIESTRSAIKPLRALSRLRKKGKDFSGDSVEVLSILSQVHDQFDQAKDMPSFLKMVVGVVRELTGFHRVMIYQVSFPFYLIHLRVEPRASHLFFYVDCSDSWSPRLISNASSLMNSLTRTGTAKL